MNDITLAELDVEVLPERSTLRTVVIVNGGAAAIQEYTILSLNKAVNIQNVFTFG